MKTVSPVVPGLEAYERTLGGAEHGQPEYDALPMLRSPNGIVVCRWTFSDEEREAIANGEDLYVSTMTFNNPFQPVKVEVGLGSSPENFKRIMRLDDEFELRALLKEANETAIALQNQQLAVLNADKTSKDLAVKAQQAKQALDRKKAEVFSDKPSTKIEVVQ